MRSKGGKGAPVPVSMHQTKGSGHTVAGMAGTKGATKGGGKGVGGAKSGRNK
jgi:hypothetical protein